MALIIKDRVKETTATVGTIPFVCGGAVVEFQSFSSAIGDANTTLYVAEDVNGTNWEVGVGQYVLANNSLLRTTILASSNNSNIVNFPVGSKNLFVTIPAAYAALTARDLSQFAATSSANLASIITDETGSGRLVFSNNAVLANATLGTANATTIYLTNDLRAGNVYSNGQIVLTSEPLATAAYNTANTVLNRTFTFFQNTTPTSSNTRDQWIHADTGVMYENFGNTSSPIWAEVGPTGLLSNTTPGIVSATQVLVSDNVILSGSATVANNASTDKYINIGTNGQLFDDGNFHVHTKSGNLWLNSLDGGDINLGLQTNSGTSKAVTKNLSLDAGYGSTAPIYGVRAWINCGWNGSSMTTRGSGNLSVSRGAIGVYNFTFGTAMPDANYCITATAQTPGSNSDCAANITNGTTPSTTGFSLTVARYGNGNEDTAILNVQVVR